MQIIGTPFTKEMQQTLSATTIMNQTWFQKFQQKTINYTPASGELNLLNNWTKSSICYQNKDFSNLVCYQNLQFQKAHLNSSFKQGKKESKRNQLRIEISEIVIEKDFIG
jgi:hypothetical protein